jgi:protein-L-isoaspartate(D-aspartate) O-methyltransferase
MGLAAEPSARVRAAFEAVPRERFLPSRSRHRASYDGPIPIGKGQTSSQPRAVRSMLELLVVEPGQRVLDVGAGSGWTTALLARLTGPEGQVVGVELEPSLVRFGSENLAALDVAWAGIRQAEAGVLGVPELAPYDRILVSANATSLPQALVDQLGDGGRMVLPVDSTMLLVVRDGSDVATTQHGAYRFVPLR